MDDKSISSCIIRENPLPPDDILISIIMSCANNCTIAAKRLNVPNLSIYKRLKELRLKPIGRKNTTNPKISDSEFLILFKKHSGNGERIAKAIGITRQGVRRRVLKLGLKLQGRFKIKAV